MKYLVQVFSSFLAGLGNALLFLGDVVAHILKGHVRFKEVLRQIYDQGLQSTFIIALTSFATGMVLALQAFVVLSRFGAKENVSELVAWSIVREMGPVFTAIIFSAKAGARITAELGTMSVNDQILATRSMGIDPIEFLIVPRMIACFLVIPILAIVSEVLGIAGGYVMGTLEANIPGSYYMSHTLKALRYVDFFSGYIKVFFFAVIVGWTCCYQGFFTTGGSLGVGKFTTRAVSFSIIFVLLSNAVLTKIIITFWR